MKSIGPIGRLHLFPTLQVPMFAHGDHFLYFQGLKPPVVFWSSQDWHHWWGWGFWWDGSASLLWLLHCTYLRKSCFTCCMKSEKEGKRLLQSISSLGWSKGNSTQEKQPVLTGKNKQVSCKFDLQLLLSRPQRVAIPFSWFTRHLKWLIDPGEFWPDQGMFFFFETFPGCSVARMELTTLVPQRTSCTQLQRMSSRQPDMAIRIITK